MRAAFKPTTFVLERSVVIAAGPERDAWRSLTPSRQAAGTKVIWHMTGPMPYLNRLVTIFFNMDRTVGSQFEQGLAALKSLAERAWTFPESEKPRAACCAYTRFAWASAHTVVEPVSPSVSETKHSPMATPSVA